MSPVSIRGRNQLQRNFVESDRTKLQGGLISRCGAGGEVITTATFI